ncbi:ATP-dependent DNA helicase RecQ [Methylomonas sp. LW13]|uniref:protein DpdF n=1 Tax=unclassified Methylomonas TaxID=2608980 RepID=UPI00051AB23D|nr:protein DpdF [Methylomonas sp. LW13]QBC28134.1 ATP-dependent DNA helicase RecQ [Methylomonas sp. LW13]
MDFDFSKLQEILLEWPSLQISELTANDSLMDRILQILKEFGCTEVLQKSDLQPLIRHILLRESSNSGCEKNLRVPADSAWPSEADWTSHGVSVMRVGCANSFLLSVALWNPTWLDGGNVGVFTDAFSNKTVREDGRCLADPFITDVTGYEYYSSPGQREAIRGAFLIPPGDTLIVNLPTGSGKSLVGQAPALVHYQDGHLTLFVVPTVALAIDQARQMEQYFLRSKQINQAWPLAWYGAMPEIDRSEIRHRMLEGTQRILFTSPEALTTSLLRTVFEVAQNGMLRYIVIDEAHLITQWGDEFRPEFQVLAGLRNSLLRKLNEAKLPPFRTLLLSATFTPETIDTLANLFGPPERVQMIAAVHLRPEPQYWFYKAQSRVEKQERILEALRHAPRPFILYVTTREDATLWYRILKNAGLKRIQRFDGGTHGQERKRIIDGWISNKLDGIVATSAFGVGIDKADVRTILHATIPETLDRFYQEVGRGGRDGMPSVSLLVYEDTDWVLTENMANPRLISNELGMARWRALYESRKNYTNHGELIRIDLRALRQGMSSGFGENLKWNMRTLMLMARAGFLELDVEPNSMQSAENDTDSYTSAITDLAVMRIRLFRNDHCLESVWEDVISNSRQKTLNAGIRNLKLMQSLLNGEKEVSEILKDLYRNNSVSWPVSVTQVCGGCPVDRFRDNRKDQYHVPIAVPIYNLSPLDLSTWQSTFPHLDPTFLAVFYEPGTPLSSFVSLVKWLVIECNVKELSVDQSSDLAKLADWRKLYRHARSGIVINRELGQLDEEPYSPLARVTVFDERITSQQINKLLFMQRPAHWVFYPSNTADPNYPHRLIADTATNSARLEQLLAVIKQ